MDEVGRNGWLDRFGEADFRRVLGHFPTGVTIVTGLTTSGPVGMSVNSFTSASLDPPLIAFLPALTSRTWPALQAAGAFCVNVLATDQHELAHRFATGTSGDRFAGVGWAPSPRAGLPTLSGVTAWIECALESVTPAGDHLFVLGRVLSLAARADADPLLFHRGSYRRLGPE